MPATAHEEVSSEASSETLSIAHSTQHRVRVPAACEAQVADVCLRDELYCGWEVRSSRDRSNTAMTIGSALSDISEPDSSPPAPNCTPVVSRRKPQLRHRNRGYEKIFGNSIVQRHAVRRGAVIQSHIDTHCLFLIDPLSGLVAELFYRPSPKFLG